jgi:two-component system KDP operon response regulator KdpE
MDKRSLAKLASLTLIALLALPPLLARGEGRLDPEIGQAQAVVAEHGMVVAQEALAARIGADDYVTKPVGMDELLARVRRNLARTQEDKNASGRIIEIGDFRIDVDVFRVAVKGREVRLTPKEFELLLYLARHAERVVTHRALLLAIWGVNSVEQPEHLRVLVAQIRKKIEPESAPRYIVTEPWVGYRFNPSGQS